MGDYGYSNGGYSKPSYGANGGDGDGGFMVGGSQDNARTRNYDDLNLRPVTIKQVNDAEQSPDGESFKIDNQAVTQITFVGQIRNVSTQTTMHTYRLDDGTGTIEVKQWTDPEAMTTVDENGQAKAQLNEGVYARIFGTLKSFNNKVFVGARPGGLRAVTDHNEVQAHLLEATVVHLSILRGPPSAPQKGADANGAAAASNGGIAANGKALPAGMSAPAKRVWGCLQSELQTNEGLHMHDIAARLGMDPADVEKGGNELVELGMAYSTVDEQTWAVLDGF